MSDKRLPRTNLANVTEGEAEFAPQLVAQIRYRLQVVELCSRWLHNWGIRVAGCVRINPGYSRAFHPYVLSPCRRSNIEPRSTSFAGRLFFNHLILLYYFDNCSRHVVGFSPGRANG